MKRQLHGKNSRMHVNEKKEEVLPLSLHWYRSDPQKKDFVVWVKPMWPLDTTEKDVVKKDLKAFVESQIKKDIKSGYLKVEIENYNRVAVIFNSDLWLRDNFIKRPKVEFQPPRTLNWRMRKMLPDGLMGHADWIMVQKWLRRRFKEFVDSNQKKIFADKLKLFKKANMSWFDVEVDLQMNRIYLKLKTKIMMTLAIGAYALASKKKEVNSFKGYDL